MKKTTQPFIAAGAYVFLATPALAHPGHADPHGFAAGVMHAHFGSDHLLAVLAVGLCAALFAINRKYVLHRQTRRFDS